MPRKAADHASSRNNGHQEKGAANKTQTSPSVVAGAHTTEESQESSKKFASQNEEKPVVVRVIPVDVNKDRADYLYIGASLVIAVVTLCLAGIAWVQAKAALLTAKAMVNSERAWVMADLRWRDRVRTGRNNMDGQWADLDLFCKNDGRTPAWITEKFARLAIVTTIPEEPDFSSICHRDFHKICTEPLRVGGDSTISVDLACEGLREAEKTMIVYGFVRYRDVFSSDSETRFGYIFAHSDQLERIENHKYNQNT